MKFFESSLRPVSADKRLVAREVAFNVNALHETQRTGWSTGKPATHDNLSAAVSLYSRKQRAKHTDGSPDQQVDEHRQRLRELRAGLKRKSAERRCLVKREQAASSLQLESVWLKKQIVTLLKKQQLIDSLVYYPQIFHSYFKKRIHENRYSLFYYLSSGRLQHPRHMVFITHRTHMYNQTTTRVRSIKSDPNSPALFGNLFSNSSTIPSR
jgi:hypothetical protein